MVEQAIEDIGGISVGAFDGQVVEGGVVVGDELIKFQSEVPEARAVGSLQDSLREEKALAVAARGFAFTPDADRIQAGDCVDYLGQSLTKGLFMEVPIRYLLDVVVGDALGELRHRVGADVTAISHDGGDDCAHILDELLVLPGWREEMAGEVELVIHFNQEVGQLDRPHPCRQPTF